MSMVTGTNEVHMFARLRFALLVALTAAIPVMPAAAQQGTAPAAAGPRLEATAAAFRAPAAEDERIALLQARTNSMGKPIALMVVGGAAIVLGALIGDDIGTLFTIGGAVALIYGLYLYLR